MTCHGHAFFHRWMILLMIIINVQCEDTWLSRFSGEEVDQSRLVDHIETLSKMSDDDFPAVTRVLFTDKDVMARRYIISLMEEVGLDVQYDGMGSIVGTWSVQGSVQDSAVMTGSHCDAIPLAGAYDGTVGVLGGIEAVRVLKKAGFVPYHPIQVIMFTSEEPTRFGLSCISSRVMAGALNGTFLSSLRDADGVSFLQAASKAGYVLEGVVSEDDVVRNASSYAISSFVELHIEQGPELERSKTDIGVVTSIAAPSAFRVRFEGQGGHAGALLMPDRHDAALAAAELALEVERAVLDTGSVDIVGTTGSWSILPGAINSVPRVAELEIDIRDTQADRRDGVISRVKKAAESIAKRRGVDLNFQTLSVDPPAISSPLIVDTINAAATHFNLTASNMVSRAYHDSLFMAQVANMGMIFIPCKDGKSHRPDEYASPKDIAQGVKVLAYTLARLSSDGRPNVTQRDEL
jgi:ureidoglycolate amidohydrolase